MSLYSSPSDARLNEVLERSTGRVGALSVRGRYHLLPRRLEDDYLVDHSKCLGTGYNGSVLPATSVRTGVSFAVKSFKLRGLGAEKLEELAGEVEILLSMDHPHVVRLMDVYQSDEEVSFVMETLEGGELFERAKEVGRFPEAEAAGAMLHMLRAVDYLHSEGVVHRDLKLENFMYDQKITEGIGDFLKLIDFGFSKFLKQGQTMKESLGSVMYVAPEVLSKNYSGGSCDMWSLGVIVFRLLMVQLPFSTEGTKAQVRARIRSGVIGIDRPKRWDALSDSARNFIERLLVVDPEQRMTAEQAFEHPWITGHNSPAPGPKLVDGTILEAFSSHAGSTRLRRAFLHVAARSQIGHEVVSSVAAFTRMDSKHFGIIRLEALPDMLRDGCDLTQDQIGKLSHALDTFGTGEMDYSTFLAALLSSSLRPTSHIVKDAFRRLDADHSGYITGDDLRAVLGDSFEGTAVDTLLLDEQQLRRRGRMCFSEFAAILAPDQKVEEQPSEHEVNYKLEL
mmetsp:Transcript_102406/g.271003  ORF Transcript_102406/g.271003 Transcript_102406/m.271003 type:complete len:508 (-) Transcript_102406:186-1709(-)